MARINITEVFFDMDSVLVDFGPALKKLAEYYGLGFPEHMPWEIFAQDGMDAVVEHIVNTPSWWENLAPVQTALDAFGMLNTEAKAFILSSPAFVESATPKLKWCMQHVGCDTARVILTSNKTALARGNRMLIDDRADTCAEWVKAGGVAILVAYPHSFNVSYSHLDVDAVATGRLIVTSINTLVDCVTDLIAGEFSNIKVGTDAVFALNVKDLPEPVPPRSFPHGGLITNNTVGVAY